VRICTGSLGRTPHFPDDSLIDAEIPRLEHKQEIEALRVLAQAPHRENCAAGSDAPAQKRAIDPKIMIDRL